MRTASGLSVDPNQVCSGPSRWARKTLAERFWSHVDKSGSCWLWTGRLSARGYGSFGIDHRTTAQAHRVSWVLANRSLKPGELVLHKLECTSKACVRPDHLYVGDQKQNMRDAKAAGVIDGRNVARGAAHYRAKLTDEQVAEVISRYRGGERSSAIGAAFGITRDQVTKLARGDVRATR